MSCSLNIMTEPLKQEMEKGINFDKFKKLFSNLIYWFVELVER